MNGAQFDREYLFFMEACFVLNVSKEIFENLSKVHSISFMKASLEKRLYFLYLITFGFCLVQDTFMTVRLTGAYGRFFLREKQVFLVGSSLAIPKFPHKPKNRLNISLMLL